MVIPTDISGDVGDGSTTTRGVTDKTAYQVGGVNHHASNHGYTTGGIDVREGVE